MTLYELIRSGFLAWCEEEWWFSVAPSRKEKLRGETSLANMKVTLRVVSVQSARTIVSSIRRTSSGGLIGGTPGKVASSPPLSLLVKSMAGRGIAGGGIKRSGLVGGRQLLASVGRA